MVLSCWNLVLDDKKMYFGWWGLKKHLLPFGSDTVTNFTDSYPQYSVNPGQIAAECPDRIIWQPQYILKFFMHSGYRWQPPRRWFCTKPHRIDTLYGKKLILEPVPASALVTSLTLNIVTWGTINIGGTVLEMSDLISLVLNILWYQLFLLWKARISPHFLRKPVLFICFCISGHVKLDDLNLAIIDKRELIFSTSLPCCLLSL